jgi:transcriptional regulator with XRE-family HTH domain
VCCVLPITCFIIKAQQRRFSALDYKTLFIKNLKNYRKENNLTQDDLAEVLGYSQKNIAKWEQGVTLPPIDVLIELSKLMDITLDELLGLRSYAYLSIYDENSIHMNCVNYVIKTFNIDPNEIIEYDYEPDETQFERVDQKIFHMMEIFGDYLSSNNIDIQNYINMLFRYTEYETIISYLKDSKHIVENNNSISFSDEFALECINHQEFHLREKIRFSEKELTRLMGDKFSPIDEIAMELSSLQERREKLKKITELKNTLIKK